MAALVALVASACSPVAVEHHRAAQRLQRSPRPGLWSRSAPEKLDIYVPDGLKQPAPVILFFYGGNWDSGSKDLYLAFGEAFASEGFVVAVADYRLYPQVKYPAFLEDGAAPFALCSSMPRNMAAIPGGIFLAGHSAGAYNAIMLVSDPHYLKNAGADISHVCGAIGLAGPYDFLPLTDPGADRHVRRRRAPGNPAHHLY